MPSERRYPNLSVIARIRKTWTKLSPSDLYCYLRSRAGFVSIVAGKYACTRQQAEDTLRTIERVENAD